jgi:uncharacterized SAM-binding protein YcdF (DUF218 family)
MVVLIWVLWQPICTLVANPLVEDDGAAKADAIVVLGGDGYGTRILRAVELEKAGYATRILVSGPANLLGHETDQTIAYAVKKGYPAELFEAVLLPQGVNSTRTEADYLGKQLQSQGITSIDLVTSNYHTSRAGYLWRKENPWLHINVVPAPDPYFTPETWFQTRDGQKTFLLEWTKTISSHLGN